MRLFTSHIAKLVLLVGSFGFAIPTVSAPIAFTGPVTEISGKDPGHIQFPTSEAALALRPRTADQKTLLVQNVYIHDLINQKGLDIRASTQADAPAWAYQSITIKNSAFENIVRREDLPGGNGLHIDHIRIAGGGNNQTNKINILIENVVIDGGDALPILVTDGTYGIVTLRNVKIRNTSLNNIQFKTDKVGSVDKIIIDNCPDIGVALIGRPGSIGEVLVRNSPDIRLGDSINATGRTGASISYIDAVTASSGGSGIVASPVPEPGTLGFAAMCVGFLFRRRTR